MMTSAGKFMLLVCVGLVVIQAANSLECYTCVGVGCNDEFNPKADGVTTGKECKQCAKSKAANIVSRICSPESMGKDGCNSESAGGEEATTCYCSSDLCNSASGVKVSMATAFVAISVAFVRKLF